MARSLEQLALSLGGVRREVDARRVVPMRPISGAPPLARAGWLYEMKLDGFRLLADVRDGGVRLRYRSGVDSTTAFPDVVAALRQLRARRVVLDGEIVAFDENGRPDFDRLAPRLHRTTEPRPPVVFMVFDVLAVGAVDVRPVPLVSRKQLVDRIVERSPTPVIRAVPYVADDGRPLAAFIVQHDPEGIVAKRADSPYTAGPSRSWIKAKRRREEEFIVTRYRCDREGRIDALALATLRGQPRGVVELGAWRVRDWLGDGSPARAGWATVARRVVVTVAFTGMTSAGRLREATVKGVRADT